LYYEKYNFSKYNILEKFASKTRRNLKGAD